MPVIHRAIHVFMRKRFLVCLFGFLLSAVLSGWLHSATPAVAQTAKEIDWGDLIPQETVEFDDPFVDLPEAQLYELSMVARYRDLRQRGKLEPGGESAQTEAKLVASLESQGIDVDWLLAQRERVIEARTQQADTGSSLSGQRVRIPGYALPLTLENNSLTEFLLVPWVGACIHTPPPPPNQIIHVAFPEGTAPRDRFSPVWIEGRLENAPADYTLYLVDGSRNIRAAYTLTAEAIAEYTPAESDALSQVTIPDGATAGQHGWRRLQAQISLLFTNAMADIQGQPFSKAFLFALLIAFLYGVLHTLGPGHGKAVIVSYFVGEGGSLRRGLWMGVRIAVLHVLAAVALAVLTDVVVRQVGGSAAGNFRIMRLISYGAIAAIGGWMLWQALQAYRRPASVPPNTLPSHPGATAAAAVLYRSLTQVVLDRPKNAANVDHTKGWGCRCLNCFAPNRTGGWLSMAIGAVPCSGALVVLLYGLANNLLGVSIALVGAISAGMAIALSGIGVLAILGRQTLDKRLAGDRRQVQITAGLRLAGAAMVFLVGGGLFVFTALSTV